MPLNEKHVQDLHKSGLSDKTIEELGFWSASGEEVKTLLELKSDVGPGMVIPYPIFQGYDRVRLDDKLGKSVRYMAKPGSPNKFYIPPLAQSVMSDVSKPLIITEGEKKAAKSCQEGIPCIACSGVWNWKTRINPGDKDSKALPDFDMFKWEERVVFIVFDSDASKNDQVKKAAKALKDELDRRGAVVFIRFLPDATGKKKVGLDDFLTESGKSELDKLLSIRTLMPHVERNFDIGKIVKSNTNPPTYYVHIDNCVVVMNADTLLNFKLFTTRVYEAANLIIELEKPQQFWKEYISVITSSEGFMEEEADAAAHDHSPIIDAIKEYIEYNSTDEEEEFERGGKILKRGGKYYIRGSNARDYVSRKVKGIKPKQVWMAFRDIGGESGSLRVGEIVHRVWVIPDQTSGTVQNDVDPDF